MKKIKRRILNIVQVITILSLLLVITGGWGKSNKIDSFKNKIINVYGIHIDNKMSYKSIKKTFKLINEGKIDNLDYKELLFESYDSKLIPSYIIYPKDFNSEKKYPTILVFSGHGNMDELVFFPESYQKAGALQLAKEGYLVLTMENRGMGKLDKMGDHLYLDAIDRLDGGSWYGDIITDALYLLSYTNNLEYVDKNKIGTAGVSSGGALSLFVSAIDNRVKATYVQGYLGSFKTTFSFVNGRSHDICNNISGINKIGDLNDIACLIAPRPALYVNGEKDTFNYNDAEIAFQKIKIKYSRTGHEKLASILVPKNVAHEFSYDIASNFFQEYFKSN